MVYLLYNKSQTHRNTDTVCVYAWVLDYLTTRQYIKFNSYYTLMYISQLIIKNTNYLISYNSLKNLIKLQSFNLVLKQFKYIKQIIKLNGVGYRLNLTNNPQILLVTLGYSHKLYIKLPESIFYVISNDNTSIELSSSNYSLLTATISKLKKLHKFDPYKGKGIKLVGDVFTPKFYKK